MINIIEVYNKKLSSSNSNIFGGIAYSKLVEYINNTKTDKEDTLTDAESKAEFLISLYG